MKKQLYTTTALFVGLSAVTLGGGCLLTKHLLAPAADRQTPTQELQAISTPDSLDPTTQEWRGLCPKNSVGSVEALQATINNDPVLKAHFSTLDLSKATTGTTTGLTRAVVYHRKGNVLAPTSKAITIPAGDKYVTDGVTRVRMQCCNDYVVVPPAPPVETYSPPAVISHPTYGETPLPLMIPVAVFAGEMEERHDNATPVPEPSQSILFGGGLVLLVLVLFSNRTK